MTALDILFWLLVALLGCVAWAIESGLGNRYRNLLASSVLAAAGSGLFIMFVVDDKTVYAPLEAQQFAKQKRKGADGQFSTGEGEQEKSRAKVSNNGKEGGPRAADDAGGSSSGGAGSSGKDGVDADDQTGEADLDDDNKIVYGREPFQDCPICPDMVIVSAGVANIGSAPDEPGRTPDEAAAVSIPIGEAFAIGRVEINREEFDAFIKQTRHEPRGTCDVGKRRGHFSWHKPGFEQDERHPVVCVGSSDVRLYLSWLSEKTSRSYRLPTEIEWEYAARAGATTPYWTGAKLNRVDANIGKVRDGTTVGGTLKLSPFGLADVIGNAGEMVADCAVEPEKPGPPPAEPPPCRRIVKGGSWASPAAAGRHAARDYLIDGALTNTIGFRVVRPVDERDNDKRLTVAQRRAIAKAEREDAEIKAREREASDEAKRAAREAPPPDPKQKGKQKADPKAKTDPKAAKADPKAAKADPKQAQQPKK